MAEEQQHWSVYVLRCADGTLYTGITTDVFRRVKEHNEDDKRAARYTRCRRPLELIYSENVNTRAHAAKREAEIRKLSRVEKLALCGE